MLFNKSFSRKVNQFRKQNWSAPAIMGFFIAICMMVIFGFETLGLAQRQKNLDMRVTAPEKSKIIVFY